MPSPDLRSYDVVALSVSGGKDGAAMLHVAVGALQEAGVLDRAQVVHCDLGDVDWEHVPALAERHAARYGLPFTVARREQDTLLEYAERRGKWPSASQRWCTSTFKRDPVRKLMTAWARDLRERGVTDRPVRILDVMGIRAAESPARAKHAAFAHNAAASNGRRHVDTWYPVFELSLADVRQLHETHQLELHQAYRLGMRRLSCSFCVLSSRADLVQAARLRPQLAKTYVGVEARTGHTFRQDLSMATIVAQAGTPDGPAPLELFTADESPATWDCPTWPPMTQPIHMEERACA